MLKNSPLETVLQSSNKTALAIVPKVQVANTCTSKVTIEAHCPGSGVKVYVAEFILSTTAGDHDPVIPLFEVFESTGAVSPEQIGTGETNEGTVSEFTVIEILSGVAQIPVSGVKVYIPELVLLTIAGDHVPGIPLFDIVGKI